jgi:hypothetical protein
MRNLYCRKATHRADDRLSPHGAGFGCFLVCLCSYPDLQPKASAANSSECRALIALTVCLPDPVSNPNAHPQTTPAGTRRACSGMRNSPSVTSTYRFERSSARVAESWLSPIAAKPRSDLLPKHLSGVLVEERLLAGIQSSGSTSGSAKPATFPRRFRAPLICETNSVLDDSPGFDPSTR